jgi:hypothetical protein
MGKISISGGATPSFFRVTAAQMAAATAVTPMTPRNFHASV